MSRHAALEQHYEAGRLSGQQLQEFFAGFREMHGSLRSRAEHDVESLVQAEQLVRDGRTAEASALLADLLVEKRALLS